MNSIVDSQRAFFNSNKTKSIDFRIRQLKKLKRLLIDNEALLNRAIYVDFKKSAFENMMNELAIIHKDIDEAIKNVKNWSSWKKVKTNLINFPARSYVIPEPLGVSLVIGAWNYPYQLSLSPVVASMAAGNTIVLKPSELPKETSKAMAEIINNNFDPNYFKVIEGGVEETTALLNHRFDKIFFTGSVRVGRIIYQAAAKFLTPVTLELGGKSPAIVTEDCNLKMSVKRLIWSKFLNAGQTCISPDYVLVHDSIKDKFLEEAKRVIIKERYGFDQNNYVQIINKENINRLASLISSDKVYHGGKYDVASRFFEPTILKDVSFEDQVMKEEIFGPILPVLSYTSIDEAISNIKTLSKPLACYVYTNNKCLKNKVLTELSFGGGGVNDSVMHITNNNMAFGGVGESGIGAYHGENGFRVFSHYKSILDKPTWFETNLKYYPRTKLKYKWIKLLFRVK